MKAGTRLFWIGLFSRASPPVIAIFGLAALGFMIGTWAVAFQWLEQTQESVHAQAVESDTTIHQLLTLSLKLESPDFATRAYALAQTVEPVNHLDPLATPKMGHELGVSFNLTIPELLDIISSQVEDDEIERGRAVELVALVRQKLAQRYGRDVENEDKIRGLILTMIRHEEGDLEARRRQSDSADRRFAHFSAGAAAGAFLCLMITIVLMATSFALAKRAQEQSLVKERQFRAVVENGADAFFLFRAQRDPDGHFEGFRPIYLNSNAEQMLAGADQKELTVDGLRRLIAQDAMSTLSDAAIFHAGSVVQSEIHPESGPLQDRDYQEQIIPLPDGIAITYRDITERTQVERLRSEFIASVSHELRTPLTAIRGSIGLIHAGVAGEVPNTMREMIRIAHDNSERLMRMIADVLDIARLESGNTGLRPVRLDLREVLQLAINNSNATAAQAGVRVMLVSCDARIAVLADPDRVAQVLRNLLSNAIRFSKPEDEVTCSCNIQGRTAVVEVRDRGPGIPEDFHGRIFGKFMQADTGDQRQTGGAGLGLAIAKSIVEGMGGTIGFRPATDGGTVFFFSMPLPADYVHFGAEHAA